MWSLVKDAPPTANVRRWNKHRGHPWCRKQQIGHQQHVRSQRTNTSTQPQSSNWQCQNWRSWQSGKSSISSTVPSPQKEDPYTHAHVSDFGTPKVRCWTSASRSGFAEKHRTARFFSALSCTAHWHAFLSHLHSSIPSSKCWSRDFLTGKWSDTAIRPCNWKVSGATAQTHFHSRLSQIRTQHT